MKTPPSVVGYRLITVVISLVIIALVVLEIVGALGPSGPKAGV